MKKLAFLLSTLMLNVLCIMAEGNVTIKMRLQPAINTAAQTVYVYHYDGNEYIIDDSVHTAPEQSEYTLKCNVEEEDVVRLLFSQKGPINAQFMVHPGEEVEVMIGEEDNKLYIINKRLIRGSKENDYLVDFWHAMKKAANERVKCQRMLSTPDITEAEKVLLNNKIDSCNQVQTKLALKELEQPHSPYIASTALGLLKGDIPSEKYDSLLNMCHELYPNNKRLTAKYKIANEGFKYPPGSEESQKNMRIIKTVERGRITIRNTASPTDTLQVGQQVRMNLVDSLGHETPLAKYQGKYVLLEFWASWCVPCLKAMPGILHVQKKFGDKLVVCAITIDKNEEAWKRAIREHNLSALEHFTAIDSNGNVREDTKRLIAKGTIPQNYLLDRSGKIIAINVYDEDLEKILDEKTK